MNDQTLVQRYRTFLFGLAAFMSAGTIVELWLTEHTQELLQFVPFLLCAAALIVILIASLRPSRTTIWTLRLVMGALLVGSLVGVYEHLTGNWEIVLETKPNLATLEMFWASVRGAAPMLAPGILALVAVIASAATYAHPALAKTRTSYAQERLLSKSQ